MKIKNFSDYEVNIENGTIFSYKKNRFIGNMHPKGYVLSTLTGDDGMQYSIKFHRFIWECANGNIPDGFDIHHKDGDKLNNSIFNLELMERFEHNHLHKSGESHPMYGTKASDETRAKMSKSQIGKHSKKVVQLTMDGDFIKVWDSLAEAANSLGISSCNISLCINHKAIHTKRFKWLTLEEYNKINLD